jgi:predicted short-subunit dehydrogenase-like oxidoreductase (DUF2520 family)
MIHSACDWTALNLWETCFEATRADKKAEALRDELITRLSGNNFFGGSTGWQWHELWGKPSLIRCFM